MADGTYALARIQNESLEKSLQALRGKLVGLRKDRTLKKSDFPLKTTAKVNRSIHNRKNVGDRIDGNTSFNLKQNALGDQSKPLYHTDNNQEKGTRTGERIIPRSDDQIGFGKFSNSNGNYFDDFRKKVNEIRELKQDSGSKNSTEPPVIGKYNKFEKATKESEKWKPGEARQFLLTKIARQTECMEDLESQVQELKLENQKLYESQYELQDNLRVAEADRKMQEKAHRQALLNSDARAGLKYAREDDNMAHAASVDREQAQRERLMRIELEARLEESKMENAQLRHRVSEIAERAHLLNSIQQERVRALESKLRASMDVAQYYCDLLGNDWLDQPEDSTEEILFGALDHTTLDLLRAIPEFQLAANFTGKKRLRSYFLAVLFMVRLKNEAVALNLWQPYLTLEGVHRSGMESHVAS